jgi:hypothetical protein
MRDYIYKIITKIKKMAHKSNYIKKSELEKIKDIQGKINNISLNLAKLSLTKDELKDNLKKFYAKQEDIKKILEKKYGNVSINLLDGEMTANNPSREPEIKGADPSKSIGSGSGSGSGSGVGRNWGG